MDSRLHHHDKVAESFNESFENLGLGYIDLYLMHWPQFLLAEGACVAFTT